MRIIKKVNGSSSLLFYETNPARWQRYSNYYNFSVRQFPKINIPKRLFKKGTKQITAVYVRTAEDKKKK